MKAVHLSLHKASSRYTGSNAPNTTICIVEEIPDIKLVDLAEFENRDAANLELALWHSLPRGVYDRLAALIMRRQASLLIVSGASLEKSDTRPVDALLPAALKELRRRVINIDYVRAPLMDPLGICAREIMDEAAVLLSVFPRSALPDWVEILANGNRNEAHAVIGIAMRDMAEEDYANGR